jgi:5'-nucleotidase
MTNTSNTNKPVKPMILLIDLDGVVVDWLGGFLKQWESIYPERYRCGKEDITDFYLENHFDEEYSEDVLDIIRSPLFYENLELQDGALIGMTAIKVAAMEGLVDPYLCSSPEIESDDQTCWSEKANWVKSFLGEFWLKRLILTKDKTLVRGHILIDDKPEIHGALTPTWEHLLFDHPYNQHITDKARFTWEDTKALLNSLHPEPEPGPPSSNIILLS